MKNSIEKQLPMGIESFDFEEIPRSVFLFDEINEDTSRQVCNKFLKIYDSSSDKKPEPILFYISSYGGSVYDAMAIRDVIVAIGNTHPIITVAMGKCMSAGAFLFTQGNHRIVSRNSIIMFHDISSADGYENMRDKRVSHKENERISKLLSTLISESCNMKHGDFLKKTERDWYVTPEEALEFGIADQIIDNVFPTISRVTTRNVKGKRKPINKSKKKSKKKPIKKRK